MWLWDSRPRIKASFYLFWFLLMGDRQSESQSWCQDKGSPVSCFAPAFPRISADFLQAVSVPDSRVQLLQRPAGGRVLQKRF